MTQFYQKMKQMSICVCDDNYANQTQCRRVFYCEGGEAERTLIQQKQKYFVCVVILERETTRVVVFCFSVGVLLRHKICRPHQKDLGGDRVGLRHRKVQRFHRWVQMNSVRAAGVGRMAFCSFHGWWLGTNHWALLGTNWSDIHFWKDKGTYQKYDQICS